MFLLEGDIEIPNSRNAIRCLSKQNSCRWPKSGGQVVIPYTISSKYSKPGQSVYSLFFVCFWPTYCISFASNWFYAANQDSLICNCRWGEKEGHWGGHGRDRTKNLCEVRAAQRPESVPGCRAKKWVSGRSQGKKVNTTNTHSLFTGKFWKSIILFFLHFKVK